MIRAPSRRPGRRSSGFGAGSRGRCGSISVPRTIPIISTTTRCRSRSPKNRIFEDCREVEIMTIRLCALLLSVLLTAATPAFGQTPPAGGQPTRKIAQTAIPDFSGVWAHPFLTGFEPPASGPGPVLNTSRSRNGVANFQQLIGGHTNPILKPHAAEIVKKRGETSRAGTVY